MMMTEEKEATTKEPSWFYVEVWVTPRDAEKMTDTFLHARLVSPEGRTPITKAKDAEEQAILDTRREHPGAKVEFFMSRKITPKKAAKVAAKFDNGSWEGWFAG